MKKTQKACISEGAGHVDIRTPPVLTIMSKSYLSKRSLKVLIFLFLVLSLSLIWLSPYEVGQNPRHSDQNKLTRVETASDDPLIQFYSDNQEVQKIRKFFRLNNTMNGSVTFSHNIVATGFFTFLNVGALSMAFARAHGLSFHFIVGDPFPYKSYIECCIDATIYPEMKSPLFITDGLKSFSSIAAVNTLDELARSRSGYTSIIIWKENMVRGYSTTSAKIQESFGMNALTVVSNHAKAFWNVNYPMRLLIHSIRKLVFPKGFIFIHARRGDKISQHEMDPLTVDQYVETALKHANQTSYLIASDDHEFAIDIKQQLLNRLSLKSQQVLLMGEIQSELDAKLAENTLPMMVPVSSLDSHGFDNDEFNRSGDELHRKQTAEMCFMVSLAAWSDHVVCTYSSNVCRFIALIHNQGIGAVSSLDKWYLEDTKTFDVNFI